MKTVFWLGIFSLFAGRGASFAVDPAFGKVRVSTENLKAHVSFLTSIRPRPNYLNAGSMNTAASYIKAKLEECGLKAELQRVRAHGKEYANVIASAGPEAASRVVLGAHYDVCGDQPGADDNMSGVAGLLEIARLLKDQAPNPRYRIDFAAYALEEPPFFGTEMMGSFVHAKSLREAGCSVRGMISLECIGFFTDAPGSQRYPLPLMRLFYPGRGDFIGLVGNFGSASFVREIQESMKAASVLSSRLIAPAWVTGVDFSDHRNYWKFGWPAVMVTDTAFYRNPNYHRVTDTLHTLDFPRMAGVVRGVLFALLSLT